jgi:hypothetical protein
MSRQTRYLIFLTINLTVLSSGCAAQLSEPAAPAVAYLPGRGGTQQSDADAAAYAGCRSVTGHLRIRQSSLTSFDAFSQLRHVAGTLEISDNPGLEDLSGLSNLQSVGALEVRGNPQLEDLRGLESLRQAKSVRVEANDIYDTVGLAGLREVGALIVKDNPRLISLRGFKGLERAQSVEIRNKPRLAAYYGLLPQLEQVEERFELRHNAGLSKREVREVRERIESSSNQPTVVAREAQRQTEPH